MAYLIDTDWVIDYLADVTEAADLLSELAEDGIAISIITYMEVYEGVGRSANPEAAEETLAAFLTDVPIVSFSLAVARRCATLRDTLRRQGKRVNARALDLIVAATALEANLTLVTRNVDDYRDIHDLSLHQATP